MKILFPLIEGRSGSDVWTHALSQKLHKGGIESEIRRYPFCTQFVRPYLHPIHQGEFSLVHANSWNGCMFKRDLPLIVTEHTAIHDPSIYRYKTVAQRWYHRYIASCEKRSFSVADEIVCVSKYAQKIIREEFGADSSQVIYNGVDIDFFTPLPLIEKRPFSFPEEVSDKITLFYAGNHSRMKGFDIILKLSSVLKDSVNILVSSGFKKDRVERISHNIWSVGTLSKEEMVQYYNLCDIYLFPSRMEGFGLTVTEAMACEKPVIATNHSSLPELVDDGKGGFLCEMDNVCEFAKGIEYLAEDEEMRKRMGKYNRNKAQLFFSESTMVEKYDQVYRRVMNTV